MAWRERCCRLTYLRVQQEDDSPEEKEQLKQDIAHLSGASTGSSFDTERRKAPKKLSGKLQMQSATKPRQQVSKASKGWVK